MAPSAVLFRCPFASCVGFAADDPLEIAIQVLVGVQIGRIAGKIEKFDAFGVLFEPFLDGLRVVSEGGGWGCVTRNV